MRESLIDTPESTVLLVRDRILRGAGPESDAVDGAQALASTDPVSWFAVAMKRVIDVVGALMLLVLLSPLLLVLAIIVSLTSAGPSIYRSRRVGRAGQQFDCLKFRTMAQGADQLQSELEARNEASGPLFKIAEDPRITPIGSWLRGTSLDELPQLWNVLRGEMSLVGPRPLPLRDVALLADADHRRHDVRPGMTGVWQVSPDRHGDAGSSIIDLDLDYIRTWSLLGDAKLLLRTVFVVLEGVIGQRNELD